MYNQKFYEVLNELDELEIPAAAEDAEEEEILDIDAPEGEDDTLKIYDAVMSSGHYVGQVEAHDEDEAYEIACEHWPEYISVGYGLDKDQMYIEEADEEDIEEDNIIRYSTPHPVDEAVILNPNAVDPADITLQMEMDDYDDEGNLKDMSAWDNATDAYHAGDVKTWKDELTRMERDPNQVNVHTEHPHYSPEPMSHEDELANEEEMVKKYQIQRAKRIAKQNLERNLFNLDFEDAE